jgi:hypothetical protein
MLYVLIHAKGWTQIYVLSDHTDLRFEDGVGIAPPTNPHLPTITKKADELRFCPSTVGVGIF